jgi:hypothetical protein
MSAPVVLDKFLRGGPTRHWQLARRMAYDPTDQVAGRRAMQAAARRKRHNRGTGALLGIVNDTDRPADDCVVREGDDHYFRPTDIQQVINRGYVTQR